MKSILLTKVETVSGITHEFFYNGLVETLQVELNDLVRTCDKYGKPTKVIKSFNPANTSAVTIVTVDVEIEVKADVTKEVKWYEKKATDCSPFNENDAITIV
jgi:hypothetical protein